MHPVRQFSRRRFLGGLTLVGIAGLLGVRPRPAAAEPPPETRRIRLAKTGAVCMAPHFVAEDLLRSEGFADVQYVPQPDLAATEHALAAGEADLNLNYALRLVVRLDAGDPVVVLAGVHTGCIEILGSDHVRSIRDLKGKKIAAGRVGSGLPNSSASCSGRSASRYRATSNWWRVPPPRRWGCSRRGRRTRSSASHQSRRNSGHAGSAMCSSTRALIAPGRSTSAA